MDDLSLIWSFVMKVIHGGAVSYTGPEYDGYGVDLLVCRLRRWAKPVFSSVIRARWSTNGRLRANHRHAPRRRCRGSMSISAPCYGFRRKATQAQR
jgi:hypothetical protein